MTDRCPIGRQMLKNYPLQVSRVTWPEDFNCIHANSVSTATIHSLKHYLIRAAIKQSRSHSSLISPSFLWHQQAVTFSVTIRLNALSSQPVPTDEHKCSQVYAVVVLQKSASSCLAPGGKRTPESECPNNTWHLKLTYCNTSHLSLTLFISECRLVQNGNSFNAAIYKTLRFHNTQKMLRLLLIKPTM